MEKFSYTNMTLISQDYAKAVNKLNNTLDNISLIKEKITKTYSWDGAAMEFYIKRFSDLVNNLESLKTSMMQSSEYIKRFIEEKKQIEEMMTGDVKH